MTQTTTLKLFVCLRKEVDVCHFLAQTHTHRFNFSFFFFSCFVGLFVFCLVFLMRQQITWDLQCNVHQEAEASEHEKAEGTEVFL